MAKLVIQIPCFNEEETLGITLSELPRRLDGVEQVEWLLVDDGSTDGTVEVARKHGVDHIVRLPGHRGLAYAFMAGLEAALEQDADIIVNIDADNQYKAGDIPRLIAPVLTGESEIVVGARPISEIADFSLTKRCLQRLGSWVVRLLSRTDIPDAPSGFRAMSREAAIRTNVFNDYTYTLETIIQAGQKGMSITSVPVGVNETLRPSRLVKSTAGYVRRQLLTVLRIFVTYRSFRFFVTLGGVLFSAGFLLGLRFVSYYATNGGAGHVQSLLLATLLMSLGFMLAVVGLLADLIAVNRKLLERLDWRIRRIEDLSRPKGE